MDWALFIPLLCLLLLLFLPVPALDTNGDDSSAPTSSPCCAKKTVGSVPYTLVDEADTSNYNCRSNCVYERDDIPGEGRFCFREGQFDVVCNGGPGQGAGKPPFSDPRSAFGFLNGQCIFEQGHSCVEYDQLLPHSKDFDNNSPQLCMDYCRENGYSIAGVAYTKECWCGDTEPTEEQFAPAADCNSFCNGDITQFCGSACRMNVYTIPGNHLPEVFTKPGEFDIQRGNKVTELEFLGEEFVLSFDLLLTNLDSGGFFSILHLTIGDDSGAYGDRTPAVWLLDRGFHIASAISGDINEYKDIFLNPPLRTNTWMRFEISQLISNNKHIFRVRVDGKLYWEIENNAPTMFPAVTIFGSNNWYSPASGKIRNIKVRTSGSKCCGKKKTGTRIVGGTETNVNEYPWIVGLKTSKIPEEGYYYPTFCGGTLVSSQWVITAAHCVALNRKITGCQPEYPVQTTECENNKGECKARCNCEPEGNIVSGNCGDNAVCCVPNYKQPEDFLVLIGEHKQSADSDSGLTKEIVVTEVTPQEYYPGSSRNDIALVKLKDPVDLNIYTPACLPMKGLSFDGKLGDIYGWGHTQWKGEKSDVLLEATQTIISDILCTTMLQEKGVTKTYDMKTGGWICAYGDGNTDTCQGDSGGPMTVEDDKTRRHTLVGVTSHGYGCSLTGYPSLYADVSSYRQWLDDNMKGDTFCPV